MKNYFLLFFTSFLVSGFSQLPFNEGFEAYTSGSPIGPQSTRWTTWSGTEGGAEDALIKSNQKFLGSNSLYLSSNAEAGGPTDIILPLSTTPLNSGTLTYQMAILVEGNKGAQINFHGSTTLGSKYALRLDFQQAPSGTAVLRIFDGKGDLGFFNYTVGFWFPLKLVANLNNSKWDVYINNLYKGSVFANETDVTSIEYFPINTSPNTTNLSGFYIDEISITHTPYTFPARNASIGSITLGDGLAGKTITPKVRIRNVGSSTITSVTVGTNYAAANKSKTITGLSLASGATTTVDLDPMQLAAGTNKYTAFIAAVNGTNGDDNASDDSASVTTKAIAPAPNKIVVAEEATGTWCQWCPRGAVFMDYMEAKYSENFVGIAVHNGATDPMTNKPYDSAFAKVISGYPSAAVDRVSDIDPSALEADFMTRIAIAPKAKMTLTGSYDDTKKELKVIVNTEFLQAVSTGTYGLAVVLSENKVTGTSSGYNQSNAYAGGKKGVMGGFETKGSPVPAAEMEYNFVARGIFPNFGGKKDAFPATINAGDKFVTEFTVPVNTAWTFNNLVANALLIDPAGKIDNGAKRKAADLSKPLGSAVNNIFTANNITLFPNPSNAVSYLRVETKEAINATITITDISGKTLYNESFESLSQDVLVPIVTESFDKGMYLVTVKNGTEMITKKLFVE